MRVILHNSIQKLKNHKKLVENFSYLSVLQILSLVFPLLTYPYLVKVLGTEIYGRVIFAQAVIAYFNIFVSFGFGLSATKEVSIYRTEKEKLSEIVSAVSSIKIIFLILSLIVFSAYTFFSELDTKLYYLSFWLCIAEIVFPTWFFQGMEDMKYITYINLGIKITFFILIFVLIRTKTDYLLYPILNGVGAFVGGIVSLVILYKKYQIRFVKVKIPILVDYLKKSYNLFISGVFIQIYLNASKIIIGKFIGMNEVAYYDLAEKITNVGKMPQNIINQVVFPKVSQDKDKDFIKKVLKGTLLMNCCFYVVLFFSADMVVRYFGGDSTTLRLLFLTVPIVGVSNVLMILTMLPLGHNKEFTQIVFLSAVIYIICVFVLWLLNYVNLYSLVAINVLVELGVTLVACVYIKKKKIL